MWRGSRRCPLHRAEILPTPRQHHLPRSQLMRNPSSLDPVMQLPQHHPQGTSNSARATPRGTPTKTSPRCGQKEPTQPLTALCMCWAVLSAVRQAADDHSHDRLVVMTRRGQTSRRSITDGLPLPECYEEWVRRFGEAWRRAKTLPCRTHWEQYGVRLAERPDWHTSWFNLSYWVILLGFSNPSHPRFFSNVLNLNSEPPRS